MKLVKSRIASLVRSLSFSVLVSISAISLASTLIASAAQKAQADELIGTTDYNYDRVLNLWLDAPAGSAYRATDGSLKLFALLSNTGDNGQRFDRIKLPSGYYQIKNRGSGQCLKINNPVNGGEISTGSCDPNDTRNQFYSGWFENQFGDIRPRNNQNGCLQFFGYSNPAEVRLANCVPTNPYQTLRHYDDRSGLVIAQGQQVVEDDWEVWIVARKRNSNNLTETAIAGDVGHAWIALVKHTSDGKWQTERTFGFWPGSNLTVNKEFNDNESIIRGGRLSDRGFAVRKEKISKSRFNWIMNSGYNQAGCSSYPNVFGQATGIGGTGSVCNCLDYATREWLVLTGNREDFRIPAFQFWQFAPDNLVDSLNAYTSRTGGNFIDGGARWQ